MSIISAGNTVTTSFKVTGDTTGNVVFNTTGGILYANSSTGGFVVPTGTTANRPTSAVNGMLRYNTTLSAVEMYVSGAWVVTNYTAAPVNTVAPVVTGTAAQNSTLTVSNGTWTNSPTSYGYQWLANSVAITSNATANTFVLTAGEVNTTVSCNVTATNLAGGVTATSNSTGTVVGTYTGTYLILAGGGAGGAGPSGSSGGGGGGAGGLLANTTSLTPGTTYSFTVGAGGAAVTNGPAGNYGSNSTAFSLTAIGGGGGGGTGTGLNGGSGGGGASYAGDQAGGTGTTGQGYAGATAVGGGNYQSGGGGGAGAAATGANGATGAASSITGSSVTYGGGGAGGAYPSGGGSGGAGGGGAEGSAGTANLGAGGGGTSNGGTSGAGGSGVVILSVLTSKYTGTTTGSPTVTTSGNFTILQYNASGTYVS